MYQQVTSQLGRRIYRIRLAKTVILETRPIRHRQIHCTTVVEKNEESSIIDGLEATSKWRKGQLSKLSDNFRDAEGSIMLKPVPEPIKINSDDEVQPMWKDMESRVTRRRSYTLEEASAGGKQVGRRNVRKTDEEAWLAAGLYIEKDEINK